MKILILETGGTIDKEYNLRSGKLLFPHHHLLEMLKRGRCRIENKIEIPFTKDSLDLTKKDRSLLLEKCLHCREKNILISHGTDTITKTAKVLGAKISNSNNSNKTIVLFGAMIPYTIEHSDALFNLGAALIAVQLLPAGVYVVMNGKVFPWNKVHKNRQKGIFEKFIL